LALSRAPVPIVLLDELASTLNKVTTPPEMLLLLNTYNAVFSRGLAEGETVGWNT